MEGEVDLEEDFGEDMELEVPEEVVDEEDGAELEGGEVLVDGFEGA